MARAFKFSAIVLIAFADFSNGATTRVNKLNTESTCAGRLECLPLSDCFDDNFPITLYPCNENGKPLNVCCKPKGNDTVITSLQKSTTPKSNSLKTTSKTTTGKPIPSVTHAERVWEGIPKSLHKKIKLFPESCGKLDLANRVSNGEDAEIGEYPWMVLIGCEVDGVKQFWCGGTLITNRTILTAAHCAYAGNYSASLIRLGEWNLTSEIDCEQSNMSNCAPAVIDANVKDIIVHPKFGNKDLPSLQNDIALITLTEAVNLTDYINAVCLSPTNDASGPYEIAGWGHTGDGARDLEPILQKATISLFDIDECNGIAPAEVRPLAKTQFCAGGEESNSCKGDSGGPLMYTPLSNGRTYQRGIVSLSTTLECGSEGKPRIYTEIVPYNNWILKNIS